MNEVWPQGLKGADRLKDNEVAQSWQFTLPRLNGKSLNGSFTLIDAESVYLPRRQLDGGATADDQRDGYKMSG